MEDKLELFLKLFCGDERFVPLGFENSNEFIKAIVKENFSPERKIVDDDELIEEFAYDSNHIYLFEFKFRYGDYYYTYGGGVSVIVGEKKSVILTMYHNHKFEMLHIDNKNLNSIINMFLKGSQLITEFLTGDIDILTKEYSIWLQDCYFDGKIMLKDLEDVIRNIPITEPKDDDELLSPRTKKEMLIRNYDFYMQL